jgi:S1-C subfamily serine protease
VSDTSPLTLEPIAGSLPLGGASGGAIVNRQGELIGVLSGTGWTPGRRGADYWINGATVEAFAHELSARPKTSRD